MTETLRYDGEAVTDLAVLLGVPAVHFRAATASTQDDAHRLAEVGAPAGTLVLADEQSAGRGRGGHQWSSPAGRGIWMTLLERPSDALAIEVLALRLGIAAARCLDQFAGSMVRMKWPNDLYVGDGKVGGILVEARWRAAQPEWVAIGFGLNVAAPDGVAGAAALRPNVRRLEVLAALVPDMRHVSAVTGPLTRAELSEFAKRDLAVGRRCSAPGSGVVRGVAASGELLIDTGDVVRAYRGGSLVLTEEQ